MRVLFIERALHEGHQVFDQIQRISRLVDGHTVALQPRGLRYPQYENITCVPCPFFPKVERIKSLLFCRRAAWAARDLQPDIVHAHFAYPEGVAAMKLAARRQIPFVLTCRGSDLLVYPREGRFLASVIRQTVGSADVLLGVSQSLCDAAAALGRPHDTCQVMPDGVDDEVFYFDSESPTATTPVVLFAGLFREVKNVLRMIDAFALVRQRQPEVRFELAGSGPLEAALRERVASQNLEPALTFSGFLDPPSLAAAMRRAAVLVLPSKSEGWGNVIGEAMACGLPVVGANVGGIPEQIVNDRYGLLCDPESTTDIAEKLAMALARKWDRQALSAHGRRFTRNGQAQRIVGIYEALLSQD